MNFEYFSYRVINNLYRNIATENIYILNTFVFRMAKPLNQIELGTSCVVKDTGKPGTLQRIFYYPTKYLVKTDDGDFGYYSTHEITFEGYEIPKTSLKLSLIHI